ncbi:hypothetical protein GY45DRAFT_20421 [Cubamyces sp. BRFM 1775]|nr:hypothetical protein GY45DRAFT_20421 [Cubamyces sp. BRFM 1775]
MLTMMPSYGASTCPFLLYVSVRVDAMDIEMHYTWTAYHLCELTIDLPRVPARLVLYKQHLVLLLNNAVPRPACGTVVDARADAWASAMLDEACVPILIEDLIV